MSKWNMKNLSDWKDEFQTKKVQRGRNLAGGDFLSSETVVLVSGPPFYDQINSTNDNASDLLATIPIGLVQNVQVGQQKQINQIFEIGGPTPYFIPGRTLISAGMSRVLFDGPSLMYALYMTQSPKGINGDGSVLMQNFKGDNTTDPAQYPSQPAKDGMMIDVDSDQNYKGLESGYNADTKEPGLFFINLASSYFNNPVGLGFILYDAQQQPYGGFYLEECLIQSHQFSVAAQQTVLVENISLRTTGLIPLDPADFSK